MRALHDLGSLTDTSLLAQLGELVRRDHQHTAELLRHLDEVDRRELWAKYGHPSMFDFCVVRYHMSESEAGKRIGAARAARRFPVLFEMVARGELHLSGIHRLKAHLTEENHGAVLAEAKHKTIKEIERLVARLSPQPDVPSRLRALPVRAQAPTPPPRPRECENTAQATEPVAPRIEPSAAAFTTPRAPDPRPLSPQRYKLQVTLDEQARDELVQLQALLAHQIPDGDPAQIVTKALHLLLEQTLKTKTAATERPRPAEHEPEERPARPSRSVPADIRRAVWARDQGRCAFVGQDGRRCGATRQLEYAHGHPWAQGGEHSVGNVSLRCRAHNAYEARRDYGEAFMAMKQHRPRERLTVREAIAEYASRLRATVPARSRAKSGRGSSAVAWGPGQRPGEAHGSAPLHTRPAFGAALTHP